MFDFYTIYIKIAIITAILTAISGFYIYYTHNMNLLKKANSDIVLLKQANKQILLQMNKELDIKKQYIKLLYAEYEAYKKEIIIQSINESNIKNKLQVSKYTFENTFNAINKMENIKNEENK